jgi:hypothetical protein
MRFTTIRRTRPDTAFLLFAAIALTGGEWSAPRLSASISV